MTAIIETDRLAKRYRRVTALNDCTISVPQGRISALVGPNGAGKTTLLRLLTGLAAPSAGEVNVLGGPPRQEPAFLSNIGFLAQEIPLYRALSAKDHIKLGAHLNPRGIFAPHAPRDALESTHTITLGEVILLWFSLSAPRHLALGTRRTMKQ